MADPPPVLDDEVPGPGGWDYSRTVALSDGVFAIALTLLVLNIGLPSVPKGSDLGDALLDQSTELESYAIGFAVISLLWMRHHAFFGSLRAIDGRLIVLNLLYLGLVAFLPYPTRVLGRYGDQPASVVLYAVTVAVIALVSAVMREYARSAQLVDESRLLPRQLSWVAVVVFLASIPIAFVSTKAAELCWIAVLVPRLGRRVTRRLR
jgi:uncharacterized membrane protein